MILDFVLCRIIGIVKKLFGLSSKFISITYQIIPKYLNLYFLYSLKFLRDKSKLNKGFHSL